MVGRGGDQRALTPPDGRDLQYARLLFDALWSRTSKPGRRFAKDHEILYQRWLRLARVIIRNNGGATPFGSLGDTDRVLDLLELPDDRNSCYPSPRDLNDEELASLKWQRAIASEALDDIYVNLGQPLDQREKFGYTSESWNIYNDASTFLLRWGDETAYEANPNIKRKRWRRREIIVNYRREVATFCKRWRLNAWWAVPAIIQNHFLRADDDFNWDRTIPPLSMYLLEPNAPVTLPLTVKLPGRTDEEFEIDRARALDLVETTVIQTARGPIRGIRAHLSREERTGWERSNDSSCVLFEWDGHRYLKQTVGKSTGSSDFTTPPRPTTPSDYLIDQCQQRIGRSITYREARSVRSQVSEQTRDYRIKLVSEGWSSLGGGDHNLIAETIARLLLSPNLIWEQLAPVNHLYQGKSSYGDFQSIWRSCRNFARLANLTLPSERAGRIMGKENIVH